MGLPRALKAHGAGSLEEAEIHYRRAYEQGQKTDILYQNFGALLKKVGKIEQASLLFEEGITFYPKHAGIKRNYANLLRAKRPAYAIELYISAIHLLLPKDEDVQLLYSCCDDLIELLRERQLLFWSQSLIQFVLVFHKSSAQLLKNLLLILDRLDLVDEAKQIVLSAIEIELRVAPLKDAVGLDLALAAYYLHHAQQERSLQHFERAFLRIEQTPKIDPVDGEELQELISTNSWNYACALLALQKFHRGWPLFDHGLRTPAPGLQRWQRALAKPFDVNQIPIWSGKFSSELRLLLLDEQAVGDGMMFLSLIPALLRKTKHIGLFLSPRLAPIYSRSFAKLISEHKLSIFTKDDLSAGRLKASAFDFQIPLGSICQYGFLDPDCYAPRTPILIADHLITSQLRNQYKTTSSLAKRLVGISWRGGGRGARIKEKSIDVALFGQFMLKHPDIRFVDLQYGNTADQIKSWQDQGIDIIHDPQINPLKDMDRWLSQVQACDAVVSVANTTIHGAGGLNIPTQCLLSRHSDWRWLIDPSVMRSYWYPSVGIARETKNQASSWSSAMSSVSDWLHNDCPMPTGPIKSVVQ